MKGRKSLEEPLLRLFQRKNKSEIDENYYKTNFLDNKLDIKNTIFSYTNKTEYTLV